MPSKKSSSLEEEIASKTSTLATVNAQSVRAVRKEVSRTLKPESGQTVIRIALGLLQRGGFPNRMVAYEVILHHPEALAMVGPRQLAQLGRGLASWGAVDTFACYISGPAWAAGQIDDEYVVKLAQSSDRWQRRTALVSTIPLCRSDRKNSAIHTRILRICDLLIEDRDPMVVKALSWALRELAKYAPRVAEQYIQEKGSQLAALVRREVTNKIATGLKNPKKRHCH